MLRLSVIVPAYNAESRIQNCVKSILNQDIPTDEYEIIIVNDGSQDNTGIIIENLKQRTNNIIIISQPNSGVSAARNAGLKMAKGNYILFCDSDDFLDKNIFSIILYEVESRELEGCCFNLRHISSSGIRTHDNYIFKESEILDGISFFNQGYIRGFMVVWLLMRKTLIDNKILFTEEVSFAEDLEFLIKFASTAKKVMYRNFIYYNYVQTNNSLSHSYRNPKSIDFLFKLIEDLTKFKNFIEGDRIFKNFIDERIACYFQDAINLVTWPTLLKYFPQTRKKIMENSLYPYDTSIFCSRRKSELKILNFSITLYFLYAALINNWRIFYAKLMIIYKTKNNVTDKKKGF
jgi:glycosyltransferase involved in cell wall biosynthesis